MAGHSRRPLLLTRGGHATGPAGRHLQSDVGVLRGSDGYAHRPGAGRAAEPACSGRDRRGSPRAAAAGYLVPAAVPPHVDDREYVPTEFGALWAVPVMAGQPGGGPATRAVEPRRAAQTSTQAAAAAATEG